MAVKTVTHGGSEVPPLIGKLGLFPNTDLGQTVKPLIEDLRETLGDRLKDVKQHHSLESLDSFEKIWDFFQGRQISNITLTQEDVLFLLTDPVGNLIRRPFMATYFAQKLDEAIPTETDAEKRMKEVFIAPYRASAWSRFVQKAELRQEIALKHPGRKVWINTTKEMEEFKGAIEACPLFAHGTVEKAVEVAKSIWDICYTTEMSEAYNFEHYHGAKAEGRESRFLSDPGHALDFTTNLAFYSIYVNKRLGEGIEMQMPQLVREAYFMLVEDNPFHTTWVEALNDVKNLKRYTPQEGSLAQDELARKYESRGCYQTGERALGVIDASLKAGRLPPDIILADIELGDPNVNMKGTEFVRRLHESERAAGRNPMILMIYSSNPNIYREEIEALRQEGIIVGDWNKREFTPKAMVDAVNKELKKRSGTQTS
ncbi:MAG: response regulator [Candidatus Altiarchaeales archaeon]|nr:response regulator [Candidatus Altiarchaeales archaeon]